MHLVAVSRRLPTWLADGQREYLRRLPRALAPRVVEIRPAGKQPAPPAALADEAGRIRQALPRGARLVILDERGAAWTSRMLADQLAAWQQHGADRVLLIGGAFGVAEDLKREADVLWSLSPLTLPHQLVRVIVAEQLYRAWSLLQNHPYHHD